MKVKLDENLPDDLVELLTGEGHDVHTVFAEGLAGRDDDAVLNAASAEGRLLLTQDLDFSDIRRLRLGTHPGIVLLRLRDPSRRAILQRITQALHVAAIDELVGCLVVISDTKIRIRRP